MKKLIIILIFPILTFCQENFGFKIGANFSGYTETNYFKGFSAEGKNFGINASVFYELKLSDKIAFVPELQYSVVGDKTATNLNYSYVAIPNYNNKLTYLNVPLNFKFWNKIYVFGGPQISYLLNEEFLDEVNYAVSFKKKTDNGCNVGVGFKIDKMFFELYVYQGLNNLYTFKDQWTTSKLQNGYFVFNTGYKF